MNNDPEEVLRQLGIGTSGIPTIGQRAEDTLSPLLQQIQAGFDRLAQGLQIQGLNLDVTRLSVQLIYKILIEKEVVTQEELDQMYKQYVTDVLHAAHSGGEDINETSGETLDESAEGQEESSP